MNGYVVKSKKLTSLYKVITVEFEVDGKKTEETFSLASNTTDKQILDFLKNVWTVVYLPKKKIFNVDETINLNGFEYREKEENTEVSE